MVRRRILIAMLALSLGLLVRPVAVSTTVACSCAMDPDPIGAAAEDPQQAVFTGVVQAPTGAGTPVVLTRWFEEPAAPPVVWLDNAGFEDPMGGMCGTNRPPADTEWIFVAYRDPAGKFGVNLCTTQAALDTDQGQALLKQAEAVFGPAPPIPLASADPVPVATTPPVSAPTEMPGASADPVARTDSQPIPAGVLLMVAGAGLVAALGAGVLLLARRRGGGDAG